GNVGEHEAVVAALHHAQDRRERREGVGADLRARRRQAREQRGLARVGKAEKAGVRDQPQVQPQPALLARLARLSLAGRAIAVREKRAVALPPAPAADEQQPLAVLQHLAQRLAGGLVRGHGPGGNGHQDVLAARARAVGRAAMLAALGAVLGVVAQGKESVLVGYRVQEDAASLAAVAAVGPASGHVRLAPEAHAPAASVSPLDEDLDPIDEHRSTDSGPPPVGGGRAPGYGAAGMTLTRSPRPL